MAQINSTKNYPFIQMTDRTMWKGIQVQKYGVGSTLKITLDNAEQIEYNITNK